MRQIQGAVSDLSLELTADREWIVWSDYSLPFSISVW